MKCRNCGQEIRRCIFPINKHSRGDTCNGYLHVGTEMALCQGDFRPPVAEPEPESVTDRHEEDGDLEGMRKGLIAE